MNIVDVFLNAIQNKIKANECNITDYENKKNQILEIKNALYKYDISDNTITKENLLDFSKEDVSLIFDFLDSEKSEMLIKTYSIYKPLIQTYEKIKAKFSGNFEAPQYNDAIKWMEEMASKITNSVYSSLDSDYITKLKEDNDYLNNFYHLFKGNELVSPVDDFKEVNKLLDKLNLNDEEKYELKKLLGIGNIKLRSNNYSYVNENIFGKYKAILKGKREKYLDLYNNLKEDNIEYENLDLKSLINKYNVDVMDLKGALCAIFIERVFDDVNNNSLSVNDAVLKLEDIIDFSKKEESFEEEIEEQKEISNDEDIKEDPIVLEAIDIIKKEKDLINSVDEEDYANFLNDQYSYEQGEVKYQLVSLLLDLHSSVEKYNKVKEIPTVRNTEINNIKKYIDEYKTLKEKFNNN